MRDPLSQVAVLALAAGITLLKGPATVEDDRRLLRTGSGVYTVSMLDGGRTGLYYDVGEVIGQLRPEAKRVVLLGLGGGEMLRAARRTLPNAELVGVELSPLIAASAKHDFHVDDFGVRVVVEDAATYIDRAEDGSFDGVMVDVYVDDVIPPYFRSPVFFRSCRRALGTRGVLLMNVYPAKLSPELSSAMVEAGFSRVVFAEAGLNMMLVAER